MFVGVYILVLLITALIAYNRFKYNRFSKEGIPFAPRIPFIGSLWRSAFKMIHISEDVTKIYHETGDDKCRYVGLYQLSSPIILLKDLDLIKQITVKEFDHFTDHQSFGNSEEELCSKALFLLKGQNWRDMRATLSPAFTSLKIKNMFGLITKCSLQMIDYVEECCEESERVELDLKDFISRYMLDVTASTAFGLQVNSYKDKRNEFYLIGMKVSTFDKWFTFKYLVSIWLPKVGKILKLKLHDDDVNNFYRRLVLGTIKYREKENVVRPDMIHLLMEAKKGLLKHDAGMNGKDTAFATVQGSEIKVCDAKKVLTDDDWASQAFGFIFAGSDTTTTLLSFLLYEIALNQDVHRRLQDEIDECLHLQDGKPSHEMVQKMKYMDMVVSEGLRLWPPGGSIDRVCVKDFNLGPYKAGETASYTVKKGESVWYPVMMLHRDSKYWDDPEKFDPERFSDENKIKIIPFSYLPFGAGPRGCIGFRFGLVEMKIFLIHLLADFNVEPSPKTPIPVVLGADTIGLDSKEDFHLYIVKRKNKSI